MESSNGIAAASKPTQTAELLLRLWQRGLPLLQERLDILDAAATANHTASLSTDARIAAIDIAHKLAGSLGMFGYPEATEIARQIEHLLETPGLPLNTSLTALTTALRATLFPSP